MRAAQATPIRSSSAASMPNRDRTSSLPSTAFRINRGRQHRWSRVRGHSLHHPEVVKNLRVIEGPFDPHQGDFAVAGSADYQLGVVTGAAGRRKLRKFGTQRMLASGHPSPNARTPSAAAQVYKPPATATNRASTSASAMAEYEGELGARDSGGSCITAYGTHYRQRASFRRGCRRWSVRFYGTEDASQGGDAQRYSSSRPPEPGDNGVLKQQVFLHLPHDAHHRRLHGVLSTIRPSPANSASPRSEVT